MYRFGRVIDDRDDPTYTPAVRPTDAIDGGLSYLAECGEARRIADSVDPFPQTGQLARSAKSYEFGAGVPELLGPRRGEQTRARREGLVVCVHAGALC